MRYWLCSQRQVLDGVVFGFKLHLICNERGELLNFMVTPGDVDDRKPLENRRFIEMIFDKLVADKGYISKNLFQKLFTDGIQLITKLKSNMKGALMTVSDRVLLPTATSPRNHQYRWSECLIISLLSSE